MPMSHLYDDPPTSGYDPTTPDPLSAQSASGDHDRNSQATAAKLSDAG
jgi:hypothetical protein